MADPLERAKNKVDRLFMGRAGIHSVGVRRSKNAVAVYMTPGASRDRDKTLTELRQQAAPFDVIIVEDQPAVAQPAPQR